jgi:hypothetical protein
MHGLYYTMYRLGCQPAIPMRRKAMCHETHFNAHVYRDQAPLLSQHFLISPLFMTAISDLRLCDAGTNKIIIPGSCVL